MGVAEKWDELKFRFNSSRTIFIPGFTNTSSVLTLSKKELAKRLLSDCRIAPRFFNVMEL